MKTVFIFDQLGLEPIKFFVVEGNYTSLDQIYINSSDDKDKVEKLFSILDYDEHGNCKVKLLDKFPVEQFNSKEDKVVVVGFLP